MENKHKRASALLGMLIFGALALFATGAGLVALFVNQESWRWLILDGIAITSFYLFYQSAKEF